MLSLTPRKSELLEFGFEFSIPGNLNSFVATEKLVAGSGSESFSNVRYISPNFRAWFLSGRGKIEDPIGAFVFRRAKLLKPSMDSPIIREHGGEARAETHLFLVFFLMLVQKNGGPGILLTDGGDNIFYIRDQNDVLRRVGLSWREGGWCLVADLVGELSRWAEGSQVILIGSY